MEVMENEDDYYEPRFSNGSISCLFPALSREKRLRKHFSYNKLPPASLRLTVLKLDGSFFGIKVSKMGKVRELKRAVEAAFHHFPKKGPCKISWAHVWGQFCLGYDGQKLLDDTDYIVMYGIQDGDQLQFIRHSPSSYNHMVWNRLIKEDFDSDEMKVIITAGRLWFLMHWLWRDAQNARVSDFLPEGDKIVKNNLLTKQQRE